MSLAIAWIDKIFLKLTLNYGVDFMARYKGLDPADVKTDWAHELGCFDQRPAAIKFALENLPDRAPTAQQFKGLCLSAPHNDAPAALTHEPKADPARVAAELSKLGEVRNLPKVDHHAWARRHIAEHAAGIPKNQTVMQMAKTAMGVV